jgi:hypothetical protein
MTPSEEETSSRLDQVHEPLIKLLPSNIRSLEALVGRDRSACIRIMDLSLSFLVLSMYALGL